MTRAERRRQARMQEKCQVPLNLNLTVAQVSGMTGQQASILQTYLKRMEQQTTETATDAVIREAHSCNKWEAQPWKQWEKSIMSKFLKTR